MPWLFESGEGEIPLSFYLFPLCPQHLAFAPLENALVLQQEEKVDDFTLWLPKECACLRKR